MKSWVRAIRPELVVSQNVPVPVFGVTPPEPIGRPSSRIDDLHDFTRADQVYRSIRYRRAAVRRDMRGCFAGVVSPCDFVDLKHPSIPEVHQRQQVFPLVQEIDEIGIDRRWLKRKLHVQEPRKGRA